MRLIEVPHADTLRLDHVVLDLNGTLTNRGRLLEGVQERIRRLQADLNLHLVTADTHGTADDIGSALGLPVTIIENGEDKRAFVERLGAGTTAAIGNGRNDVAMFRLARLAIAIVGPEGASAEAVAAADVLCVSITDALDLLLDDRALGATLRP